MLAAERHAQHAQEYSYERHRPEETVLYRIVSTYWPEFRERVEALGSLPKFVVRDIDEYLRCGILEHGFIRVQCTDCGFERLVALCCKRRGFCPSCLGRRMSDTAVWLTEHVIPTVQIRQWVCTLPWELRVRAGYDRELCAMVLDTFVRELQRSYRWRAKRELGLSSVEDAHTGMVTVIQRFDSALRLNVHFHTLVLDGVYVKSDDGELRFLRLPRPSEDDVYEVAMRTATRVKAYLEKRGRTSNEQSNGDGAGEIEPALGACYDVAARAPKKVIVDGHRMGKGEIAVIVDGFNVYAGDAMDGRDRKRVERMCRYLARPPIATARLTETGDGDELRYELKKAWRDGTRFVRLDPYELLARICAMVPPPWFNMIRFHGVLAPNAKLREQVVASAKPYVPPNENTAPNPLQLPLFGKEFDEPDANVSHKRRKPWAWLLRHVFAIDVNVCPKCNGRMNWRLVALTADAIREGLARVGLAPRGPPKRKRAPFGQLSLPFPKMRRT